MGIRKETYMDVKQFERDSETSKYDRQMIQNRGRK